MKQNFYISYNSNISLIPKRIDLLLLSLFLVITSCCAISSDNFKSLCPNDTILNENNSNQDQYGFSVALSDNTLVVGALNDSGNGALSGTVYIYSRQPNHPDQWILQAQLSPSSPVMGERFGYSVAVNQTTLLIGAPASQQHSTGIGVVYVFKHNQQTQLWEQVNKLSADDSKENDRFGFSLALRNGN